MFPRSCSASGRRRADPACCCARGRRSTGLCCREEFERRARSPRQTSPLVLRSMRRRDGDRSARKNHGSASLQAPFACKIRSSLILSTRSSQTHPQTVQATSEKVCTSLVMITERLSLWHHRRVFRLTSTHNNKLTSLKWQRGHFAALRGVNSQSFFRRTVTRRPANAADAEISVLRRVCIRRI